LDIWGFSQKAYRIPTDREIGNALKKIGMDKVFFDDTAQAVTLAVPGMRLDLGAIAKGYAIDCAVKKLRASGIKNCLINAGGQVYALGYKFSKPWIVGIRHPRRPGIARTITVTDESASTSADYEQYFTKDAKRFAHIFNPRTGYPAQTDLASVTVVAPEGATADALSTAIFVLGKKRGEALAKKIPRVRIYCF
jgi:thiamine biosynthesis lipoprotein